MAEGSSATDSVTDVADVVDFRNQESGKCSPINVHRRENAKRLAMSVKQE